VLVDDLLLPGARRWPANPADNDYQGGFATALMLKDLKLAMKAAGRPAPRAHGRARAGTLRRL
jgi:3-hydroxyisobutyrate dehydrogenase